MKKSVLFSAILSTAIAAGFALAPASAFADDMKKDSMKKEDSMAKDSMKKEDSMAKDSMKKEDSMSKDSMKKDDMKK